MDGEEAVEWMGRVPVSHVGWSDRIISRRKLYFAVAHVQTINLFLWPFKTVPVFLAITFAMHGGSFELLHLQNYLEIQRYTFQN